MSIPTILRLHQVQSHTGVSKSTIYLRIRQGLFPQPFKLGSRACGWSASEVAAVNGARIAGANEDCIRTLVSQLHAQRQQ